MCKLHVNAELRRDPTRTTTLRKRFEGEAYRRFRSLKGRIRKEVAELDGFGLKTNRGRFDFPRSDEKVGAFMEWLRQAQRDEILGVQQGIPVNRAARQAWTSTYIESAYQRGVAQSAAEMRAQGASVDQRWVNSAFNRPIHADRVGLAYIRAYEELEGITSAMDQQISRVLAQGIAEGRGPLEIASQINKRVDKIGLTRARVLARTEVISVHAEASLNSYEEAGVSGVDAKAEFATAGDARVCPECEGLEGTVRPINEARGVIPVHPNCLPGDSLVLSRSGIAAASKRWFDGEMIVIRTASGRELTGTPNHPVLTDRGWVGMQSLDLGGNVVCDGGSEWVASGNCDYDNAPTPIHDVAESFFSSGDVATAPMPVTAPDFHGDGRNSKIAIVGADRKLRNAADATHLKRVKDLGFKGGIKGVALLCFAKLRGSLVAQFLMASLNASYRFVSGRDLPMFLGISHAGPLEFFRRRSAPNLYPGIFQNPKDGGAVEPEAVGNSLAGFSGLVPSDDGVCPHGYKLAPASVFAAKMARNDLVRDSMLARQLISGDACEVFADKVVSVDRFAFSGHVYNLETLDNWYSANGIITHNCRCSWIPIIPDAREIDLR